MLTSSYYLETSTFLFVFLRQLGVTVRCNCLEDNIFFRKYFLELRQALDKERRVNEELRNALDSEYESIDKSDERQLNIVKELQTSLTAVQVP